MDNSKVFYKMRMGVDDQGVCINTIKLVSIHESPCWYWCIADHSVGHVRTIAERNNESLFHAAKRGMQKIYKVSKEGSRVAFPTLSEAFDHLTFLKRKHLGHMKRDIEIIEALLSRADGMDIESIKPGTYGERVVPGTREVVNSHYLFD